MRFNWFRFDNDKRAFLLLRQALELYNERPLSPLEQKGAIQHFEYTWALADRNTMSHSYNHAMFTQVIDNETSA